MILLSLETATYGNSSVAIFDDDKFIAQEFLSSGRMTSIELLPAVKLLLEKAGVEKVDTIAVDCGPGSFTGIRVGIAAARGLVDGWSAKIIGVSQFDFFSDLTDEETDQLILLDAKAGGGFYYEFRSAKAKMDRGFILGKDITGTLLAESNKKIVVCGEFDENIFAGTDWKFVKENPVADAKAVAKAAMKNISEGKEQSVEAIYLHTTIKKPK